MSSILLQKTRTINKFLQNSGNKPVSFSVLSDTLNEVLSSNVYILSSKGKVLGSSFTHEADSSIVLDENSGEEKLPQDYIDNVNKASETIANLTKESLLSVFKCDIVSYNKYATIVPIVGGGDRLGNLILSR